MPYRRVKPVVPPRYGRQTIGVLVALLIVLGGISVWWPTPVTSFGMVVTRVAAPLWKVESILISPFADLAGSFHRQISLVKENQALQAEIATVRSEVIMLRLYKQKTDTLLALDREAATSTPHVVAEAISKPSYTPYDVLILNRGKNNSPRSVAVGDRVFIAGGTIIGVITEVGQTTSKATLFSSPGQANTVALGPKALMATSTGRGNGNLLVVVPQGTEVTGGMVASLPFFNNAIVGHVGAIADHDASPDQKILISLPISISQIGQVLIYPRD